MDPSHHGAPVSVRVTYSTQRFARVSPYVRPLRAVDRPAAQAAGGLALGALAGDRRQPAQDQLEVGDRQRGRSGGTPRACRRRGAVRAAGRRAAGPGRRRATGSCGEHVGRRRASRPRATSSSSASKSTTPARLISSRTRARAACARARARPRKPSFSLVTAANTKTTRRGRPAGRRATPARRRRGGSASSGSHGSWTFTGQRNGASRRCSSRPRSPNPTIPTGAPAEQERVGVALQPVDLGPGAHRAVGAR